MGPEFILQVINTLGSLGILGMFFLHTLPILLLKQMESVERMLDKFHLIRKEDNLATDKRVELIGAKVDGVCKFRQ